MKSKYYFLTSGLLAASFAISAQADDYDKPATSMDKMKSERMDMDMDKMKGERMGMGMMKGDRMMMGWHKMTGTVGNIDYAKGVLTLKSGAPEMTLHFPPASIKDLKNGDTITVNLGFSKEKSAAKD